MPERSLHKKIDPIRPQDYGLADHVFRRHAVHVPSHIREEDLENPTLYEHIAKNLRENDEIRISHEDKAFLALVYVRYASGTVVRVKKIWCEPIDTDQLIVEDEGDDLDIKMRGQKRWSIIKKTTGEVIREDIPDKATAMRELSEYRKALAA